MNVLVDTSTWSLVLRRSPARHGPQADELAELVREGRVVMVGAVRQELLSGVRTPAQYERLRDRLRAFPDLVLTTADYEDAATSFHRCRAKGLQGSNTDFLLCAVALRRGLAIMTEDGDFRRFAAVLGFKLHAPR